MILFADTNILIDVRKLDIFRDFLSTEHDIFMESSMLEDEVKSPADYAAELVASGLQVTDMTDEEFVLATEIQDGHPKLSFYDCVAYAVSKTRGWTLVTGDNRLRKLAQQNGVTVHGMIWVLKECALDDSRMSSIITAILADRTIRIPQELLMEAFPAFRDLFS